MQTLTELYSQLRPFIQRQIAESYNGNAGIAQAGASGGSGGLTGDEWQTTGDAVIDANQTSTTTTVYIRNDAAGGTANLNVEGNIVVGGLIDGVDLAAHVAATGASVHGLGTMSTQSAGAVAITGGDITGINDLAVADGGTGASTAAGARTNLGLVIGTNVQAWDADLDAIASLAKTDSNFIVGNGTTWVVESGSTVRASLGLVIGTDVQAWDADLDALAALSKADSNFIVGNGSAWVAESGATVRTSLGLGTGDSPQFTGLGLGVAADGSYSLKTAGDVQIGGSAFLGATLESIESSSFTSGFSGNGFRLDDSLFVSGKTALEVDNLTVRGRMRVYELLIQQIRATNGSVFVSSTGKVESVSDLGGGSYGITTDAVHGFAVDDLIRAQRFTGTGVYQSDMTVTAVGSTTTFTATLEGGADAPEAGMEFVRLGSTSDTDRQGSVYLSADDTYAPYIDILDGVSAFGEWATMDTIKVRLGRLEGITDTDLNPTGYGLYSENAYLKGSLIAGLVTLNDTGAKIVADASTWDAQSAVRFVNASDEELGGLYGYYTTSTSNVIGLRALSTATERPYAYLLSQGTGTGTPSAGVVYIAATNADAGNTASITLDSSASESFISLGAADVVYVTPPLVASQVVRPSGDTTSDLGTASYRWGTLYVDQIVATTLSGDTLGGAEWEYAGSMVIDANSASSTTVSITNQGAGTASLDVEGNITVGGTVDGVDIALHASSTAQHGATGAVVGTTNTQTLSNKTLTDPTISATGWTNANHTHAGASSGGQIAHTDLTSIGTNTHAQIDTHIANTSNPHSVTPAQLSLVIGTDVQAWDAGLDAIAALAVTDGNIIVGNGSTWVAESGATARSSLGLTIGTNVQAWDADLDAIAALTKTDSNFIVGNGTTWVAENGATARTSLGLGAGNSPEFTAINLGHSTDTTIARVSAGLISVEGDTVALLTATQTLANKTLTSPVISNLTAAARLMSHSSGKVPATVSDLTAWIAGTTNQITSTNDGDGTLTLSLPQDIHTAASPQFAAINFGADVQLNRAAADVLGLAAGDSFRSSGFVSGASGWKIDADGTAEFLNAFIRGELHAAVFVKDLIDAHAGSMIIAKSAGVLAVDMVVPGTGTWTMTLNDPPGGGFLLDNSDICRVKTEYASGIADVWFVVSARVDNLDGTQSYTCTYSSGTLSVTFPAGAPCIDYGVSGGGLLLMTADLSNAPYYDVQTHAGSPWSATTVKARLGNLAGITDPDMGALSGYGLYSGNAYLSGELWVQDNSVFAGEISIGTSGGIYQGTGTFASPTTGLKIWNDSGTGVIAGYNTGVAQWYADTDGKLYAGGGNAYLDEDGLSLAANPTAALLPEGAVKWISFWDNDSVVDLWAADDNSEIYTYWSTVAHTGRNSSVFIESKAPTGKTAQIQLQQYVNGVLGNSLTLDGDGIAVAGDLAIDGDAAITSDSASKVGLTVSSAASPTVNTAEFQNNGTTNVSIGTGGEVQWLADTVFVVGGGGNAISASSPVITMTMTNNTAVVVELFMMERNTGSFAVGSQYSTRGYFHATRNGSGTYTLSSVTHDITLNRKFRVAVSSGVQFYITDASGTDVAVGASASILLRVVSADVNHSYPPSITFN